MKEGILIVNKPSGLTSHDVVARIRKRFGIKKVGHAGTLDPLATGVLVVLLGKYTKMSDRLMGLDKAYRATMLLGRKTDSADIQGKTIAEHAYDQINLERIKHVFQEFVGTIDQRPPMYSAIKFKGKKLYELARKGIVVDREPRTITIEKLEILNFQPPSVEFMMECSKGTYVRQLADDIGERLGCGACISQIERTKVGSYRLNEAIRLEEINESHIQPWIN